jgi:hypothetical protein
MPTEILFQFLTTGVSAFLLAVVLALRPRMDDRLQVVHKLLAVAAAWLLLNSMIAFWVVGGGNLAPTVTFSRMTWDPLLLRTLLLSAALIGFFATGSRTPPSSRSSA